jgi:hypothetical protein
MVTKTMKGRGRGGMRRTSLGAVALRPQRFVAPRPSWISAPMGVVQAGNVSMLAAGSLAVDSSQRPTV